MKTSKYLISIVAAFIFLNSCSESLLDIDPTNKYTEDTFWKSETQADAGLAACYQNLRATGIYGGGSWTTPLWEECATPNAMDYNSSSGFFHIGNGTHDASNAGIINNRWRHCYQGIGRCNSLIDKVVSIPMADDKKTMMIAEAKFLRALFYGLLINYYGDVPLILEAPKLEHKTLPRTAKETVFTQIIKTSMRRQLSCRLMPLLQENQQRVPAIL